MNRSAPASRARRRRRGSAALRAAALGMVALALAAGCARSSGNATVDDSGYVSSDGTVRTWSSADRGGEVVLTGTAVSGEAVASDAWLGAPVVLNTWYAACPPCRAEAPDLVELAAQYEGQVAFLRINSTDDAATAAAFERTFDVPYPTVLDTDGSAVATLQGVVPVQATPTTVVLDAQGRVAARVLGRLDPSVLGAILDDLLAEDGAASASASA